MLFGSSYIIPIGNRGEVAACLSCFRTQLSVCTSADDPIELPKHDVTWLEITDDFKLMHLKVMSPAELSLALAADVQVTMLSLMLHQGPCLNISSAVPIHPWTLTA